MRPDRLPKTLTEEDVDVLVNNLILAPPEDPCRRFLESRKLFDTELLSKLEIGSFGSRLIFPQRDEAGRLAPRYRTYDVLAPKERRWGWSGADGHTLFVWPWWPVGKEFSLWVFEGEWDVKTALMRLGFAKAGLHAVTFTGGAGMPIPTAAIPSWARGRRVNICYDNDVYQGATWAEHHAPSDRHMAAMRQRRSALLRTATSFERHGCEVVLRAITLDPIEVWGGDLRDWVNAGGADVESLPAAMLTDVRAGEQVVVSRANVDAIVLDVGLNVRFRCSVQTVEEDGVIVPLTSELDCDMGTKRICGECRAPVLCPDKILSWDDAQDVLAQALTAYNFEKQVLKRYLGQPGRCNIATLRPVTYKAMCRWTAASTEDGAREITIMSDTPPNLSGETEVEGTVYHGADGEVVVIARKILHVDQQRPDVRRHEFALRAAGAAGRPTPEEIEAHLCRRADMLSKVTKIYGRRLLHRAFDLLYHSALRAIIDGERQRAWLDVAIVGDTGGGKSKAAQRLATYFQLGTVHLCMENVSRAGLTMGAVKDSKGNFRTRPGLLPRNHGKLLMLDEFHVMVEDGWGRGETSPLMHLQTARDVGYVEGVKVYGARKLSAAVRLVTISNWCGGRASTKKFPCEHIQQLYGRPEVLRRLDLPIIVTGEPDLTVPDVLGPDQEIYRILVQRAWAMAPEDILIEEAAIARAKEIAESWKERYSEDLPFFTLADKPNGLLRLAIACSNICFTHVPGAPEKCLVTADHVTWAGRFLEAVWFEIGYEEYSTAARQKDLIAKPFHVEHHLTAGIGLIDASDALQTLDRLFAPVTKSELMTFIGKDIRDTEKWCTEMTRLGALEPFTSRNNYHREWRMTKRAHQILKNLIVMAAEAPDEYSSRVVKLQEWMSRGGKTDPSLTNLLVPEEVLRRSWDE